MAKKTTAAERWRGGPWEPEAMMEQSRGANLYTVRLSGADFYWLIKRLEQDAVETEAYPYIVSCVDIVERIRSQIRAQGWGQDLPKPEVV